MSPNQPQVSKIPNREPRKTGPCPISSHKDNVPSAQMQAMASPNSGGTQTTLITPQECAYKGNRARIRGLQRWIGICEGTDHPSGGVASRGVGEVVNGDSAIGVAGGQAPATVAPAAALRAFLQRRHHTLHDLFGAKREVLLFVFYFFPLTN